MINPKLEVLHATSEQASKQLAIAKTKHARPAPRHRVLMCVCVSMCTMLLCVRCMHEHVCVCVFECVVVFRYR